LATGLSFRQIAQIINRAPSTISREVNPEEGVQQEVDDAIEDRAAKKKK